MVMLLDRAPLERVRKLADGRIAAVARFARSGVYTYSGSEVGRPDLATVNVYRPESEVFDQAAMASFGHKAITIGHPSEAVSAGNWKDHSVGWTEGKIARDGEFVEIPLMLADASAVQAYEGGARELSAGYTSDLTWGDGVAPDGTPYQATMRQIRGNHIALVAKGRAGSACRIGDSSSTTASFGDQAWADRCQARQEYIDRTAGVTFSDAERQLFDSAEGKSIIAYAKHKHQLGTAFMGDRAPEFTDAQAAAAIRAHVAQSERGRQHLAQMTADNDAAMQARDQARREYIADLTNRHRQR